MGPDDPSRLLPLTLPSCWRAPAAATHAHTIGGASTGGCNLTPLYWRTVLAVWMTMRPRHTRLSVRPLLFFLSAAPLIANAELPGNYSAWMAVSIMSRQQGILGGPGDASQLLQAGFTQKAFHQLLSANLSTSAADSFSAYIRQSVDSVTRVLSNASHDTSYPLDRLSSGNALLRAYTQTESASYASALTALEDSIALQPRNAEGGLWYYVYPNVSYLDGMYSFAPFSAAYALAYDDSSEPVSLRSAVANITYQLDLLWEHCRNASTGLLVHGYDDSKTRVWANPETGASPHVWGRSLGWYTLALVDTLEILQDTLLNSGVDAEAWHHVHGQFAELAEAIARAADPVSGAWWQVLDEPGREGNYIESSGSAMFVAALLKGSRLGYLNASDASDAIDFSPGNASLYVDVATRAYEYIAETFVVDNGNGTLGWNGTVSVCSLNSTASYEVRCGGPNVRRTLMVGRSTTSASRSCTIACWGQLLSCLRRWSTNCWTTVLAHNDLTS